MRKQEEKIVKEKELMGYRKWLAELDEEARENGEVSTCDADIWELFNFKHDVGRQVCLSFSKEELLDIMIQTIEPPGSKIHYEKMYCIYKHYVKVRFGDLEKASKEATIRRKQLKDQSMWPCDWPDRVSIEPFIEKMRLRKKQLTDDDIKLLERICRVAKETGIPPVLSASEEKRLNALQNWKYAFELMGIPALNKQARAHMLRYWEKEREAHSKEVVYEAEK